MCIDSGFVLVAYLEVHPLDSGIDAYNPVKRKSNCCSPLLWPMETMIVHIFVICKVRISECTLF